LPRFGKCKAQNNFVEKNKFKVKVKTLIVSFIC